MKSIVSNLQKEELIEIILNISNEYREIENRLLFQYAPVQDEINNSKKLIKEYINKSMHRGFIHWDHVNDALQGANMALEKANGKIIGGEAESAISLCFAVLSNVVDMLQYCDDSGGFVGGVIEESLEIIDEAVSAGLHNWNNSQQSRVFVEIMKEALDLRYEEWNDWRITLLGTCIKFSDNVDLKVILEDQFRIMVEK